MIRSDRFAVPLLAAALLSACVARDAPPAPVVHHGSQPPTLATAPSRSGPAALPATPASTPASGAATVVVRPGETLSAIARRHGVALTAIAQANGIKPPYGVRAGQKLTLPGAAVATPAALVASAPTGRARPWPVAVKAAPVVPPVAEPVSDVTVASAPRSSVQAAVLPTVVGDTLKVAPAPAATPAPERAVLRTPAPTKPAAEPDPDPAPAPVAVAAVQKASVGEPPPRAGRSFLWPVKGRLISGYGPQPGGLRNDGLNIAAERGDKVVAADNGVVAYAGDDLKGFGNLVLIKHAGGFVTTYAHNDKILVKRGDKVRRGQAIATVGESGSVTRPQVHFQVRQGAHAVDPRPLMERS